MFEGKSILVAGDFIADVYIFGNIGRISREAPVLILDYQSEKIVAGGAGNVANNILSLGGKVFPVGIVGADKNGIELRKIFTNADCSGLIEDPTHSTISKTRIVAGGRATVSQQIVRLDRDSLDPHVNEAKILESIEKILPQIDGIVLSDYGSGTITPAIRQRLIDFSREHGIPSIVDSRYDIGNFRGINFVKQNDSELANFYQHELKSEEIFHRAAFKLQRKLKADGILITRGELGMTLFESNGAIHDIPVEDFSEVFDVTGAGDTCVAAMILGLASGFSPVESARISNIAAGIAVRKLGTSTVSIVEVENVLSRISSSKVF